MKRSILACACLPGLLAFAACYSPSPEDCQYSCFVTEDPADQCPDGLVCVAGACRVPGATNECIIRPANCGNDRLDPGEDCDDDNDDNDECALCKQATCGDGFVWAGMEDCDDKNANNADGCVRCSFARCGDGEIREGVEDCESPGTGSCTASCIQCIGGWAGSPDGHCYKLVASAMSYDGAKAACEGMEGHLFTAVDQNDRVRVGANVITTTSWIGLNQPASPTAYEWVTGEPFDMMSFPNILDGSATENCFIQQGGGATWEDFNCSNDSTFGPVCEIEDWTLEPLDKHAFRVSYAPKTFNEARAACTALGGHLATILADRTQLHVGNLVNLDTWIGATRGANGFEWITPEPFSFEAWASGEPGGESCAVMTGAGPWRTADCNQPRPVVCVID